MNSKKSKSAEQQPGHCPESVIQVGIFLPVMMGGMGKITCEFPVGARMTFLAGFHDMTPVQIGLGVICRQNIMGPVTVGTLGCLFTTGKH